MNLGSLTGDPPETAPTWRMEEVLDEQTKQLLQGDHEQAIANAWRIMAAETMDLADIVRARGKGGSREELLSWGRANGIGAVALAEAKPDQLTADDREAMRICGLSEEDYLAGKRAMLGNGFDLFGKPSGTAGGTQ